jgi:hypothetical protein
MTYTARPIAPFKIDILAGGNPSTYTAGAQIPCSGTPSNTTATVSSGQITLPAGSHWRIEYSPAFASTDNSTGYVKYEIGLYSVTDSQYIGQSLFASSDGASFDPNLAGRCVASALILNSEITTSKTIEARLVSQSQMTGATLNIMGTSTFRIMELPA